jgi:hypothetical protein
MRTFFALLVLCACAFGQDRYIMSGAATIGASDYTITIRQPASGGKRLEVEQITVQAVGGEVTVATERDCSTVTTSTVVVPVAANAETAPAAGPWFNVYANSGASTCSSFTDFSAQKGWKVPDKAMIAIPSYGLYKEGSGVNRNINVRLSGNGFVALWQVIVRASR